MPVTVHKEQLDGTFYEIDVRRSRLVIARKFSGLSSITGYDKHLQAFFQQHPGMIGLPGQVDFPYPLPSEFANLKLQTVGIRPLNSDQGEYVFTFAPPDDPALDLQPSIDPPATYELDYSIESVETEYDVNGDPIIETYTPPLAPGEVGPAIPRKRITSVNTDESLQVFTYRRRELNPANPATYHNKVNSNQFDFAGETHPPFTWACRNIRLLPVYGTFGLAWDLDYVFMRRNKLVKFGTAQPIDLGWRVTTRYRDPETGESPDDIQLGNGLTIRSMKHSVDFSGLNLWVA